MGEFVMKVNDLFKLNKVYSKINYIVGEGGGENEILDIDILELPDGMYWVEKGDFIVTMGYFLTASNVTFENFIRILIQNGAAGLGVKLGRFFTSIPESAIKLAEENNFPIINYPLNTRYKEMLQPVRNRLVSERLYKSEIILEYKESLQNIINDNFNIKDIMMNMKKYIGCDFYLINKNSTAIISSTSHLHFEDIMHILKINIANINNSKDNRFTYKNYEYFTVGLADNSEGYLCASCTNKKLVDTDLLIIKETILYIIIYMHSFKTKIYDTDKMDAFFQKLLDGEYAGDDQKLIKDAVNHGISMKTYRLCAAIDVSNYNIETITAILNKVNDILENYRMIFFSCIKNRKIYIIIKVDKRMTAKFFDNIFNVVYESIRFSLGNEKTSICVSEISDSLSTLPQLINQVNFLVNYDCKDKKIIYYEDYVLENIIEEIQDNRSIKNIIDLFFDKMNNVDDDEKREIIKTITSLADNDFNLNKAAQSLFLHRNSLYKRVKKIERILNIDFENSDDKFMISLIARMIKNY